ncbi:retron system putative HNH endonuclease [Mesorhizobium sp. M0296]|uniref:retron system putative HNH endonuclease n=1 Tax=Mesorhizobium sp. M0296 TaxID=2956931 RepID=UPI00333AC6C1
MRKLDRSICPAPACLGGYTHGVHTWDNISPAHKAEIRTRLEAMQGRRCAYCEGSIDSLGQHIEHLRRKNLHPAMTFDWSNLFWSCDQTDSCGHYKDRGAGPYNVDDLLNPCCDNPDAFFIFQADGTISIRRGLSEPDKRRASETLRVFSLNPEWGRLRAMRQAAVSGYISDADQAVDAGLSLVDIHEYFADVLEYAKELPFYTAIRHVLTERQ